MKYSEVLPSLSSATRIYENVTDEEHNALTQNSWSTTINGIKYVGTVDEVTELSTKELIYDVVQTVVSTSEFLQQQQKMISLIKAKRDYLRFEGGVLVGNNWYLSNVTATAEYTAIIAMSTDIPDNTVLRQNWRTMNGVSIDMTPALAKSILRAGFLSVSTIDDASQTHINNMLILTNPLSYDYSSGWPLTYLSI